MTRFKIKEDTCTPGTRKVYYIIMSKVSVYRNKDLLKQEGQIIDSNFIYHDLV